MEPYDTHFITQLRQGENAAIQKFMDDFAGPLVTFYGRKGLERTKAEDLTYDCISKVCCEAVFKYKTGNFRAWVYQIAHNLFVDYYRQEKLKMVSWEELGYEEDNFEVGISSGDEISNAVILLPRAMASLSEEDRMIIEKRNYDLMEYTEIASDMNISLDAARKRYSRAIQRLRENLNRFLELDVLST